MPNGKEAATSGRNRYNCSQLTSFPHISVCLVYVRDEKSTVALVKVSYYHFLGGDPILNQPLWLINQIPQTIPPQEIAGLIKPLLTDHWFPMKRRFNGCFLLGTLRSEAVVPCDATLMTQTAQIPGKLRLVEDAFSWWKITKLYD